MPELILTDKVKISITIEDIRLKTNIKSNQTLIFANKSLFYAILGFTQSHSHPLDDLKGFYQLITGLYKNDGPINITGIDKIHLKCGCLNGSIVNGIREPYL